jgi:uncharacterized membrane protein YphA (DoxX/SURF4 family)
MEYFTLLGQALIGIVFVAGAVTDILDRKILLQMLQRKNVRYEEFLLPGAIALKIICGLALVFNMLPAVAAFFLAGFTLIANVIFHPFWSSLYIKLHPALDAGVAQLVEQLICNQQVVRSNRIASLK